MVTPATCGRQRMAGGQRRDQSYCRRWQLWLADGERHSPQSKLPRSDLGIYPDHRADRDHSIPEDSTVYPIDYRNNLLFSDFNGGKIRRVVLSGADLAQLGSSSIVYNGGNGFLLSLMVGADGFVYASNETTIFKVVVTP